MESIQDTIYLGDRYFIRNSPCRWSLCSKHLCSSITFILYLLRPCLISLYLKFVKHQQPLNIRPVWCGWPAEHGASQLCSASCPPFHIVSLSQWVDKQWMVIAYDSAKRVHSRYCCRFKRWDWYQLRTWFCIGVP